MNSLTTISYRSRLAVGTRDLGRSISPCNTRIVSGDEVAWNGDGHQTAVPISVVFFGSRTESPGATIFLVLISRSRRRRTTGAFGDDNTSRACESPASRLRYKGINEPRVYVV